MNKKFTSLMIVIFLASCATGQVPNNGKKIEAAETSKPTANSSFRNLYKPKMFIGSDLKGQVTTELVLDYSTVVSNINTQEPQWMQQSCSPSGLTLVSGPQSQPLIDASAYSHAITLGDEIVRKKAIWQFYVNETNKAQNAVPLNNYERTKAAREQKAQKERDAGYVTRTGRIDSRKLSEDILKTIGLGKRNPIEERERAEAEIYEKFKQDLAYNRSILEAQEKSILDLEKSYVDRLSSVYEDALKNLTSIDPQNLPMQTMRQFSDFRSRNIYNCINERLAYSVSLSPALKEDYNLTGSPYEKYASRIIALDSNDAIKKLKSSTSSSGIESDFNYLYPTADLKKIAFNTANIGATFKQRRQELVIAERVAYEKEQKRLAAEAVKRAKLRMKNNSTPTLEDIQSAVLKASIERTNGMLKTSHTEIRGSHSYDQIANVLGFEFKVNEMVIDVRNFSCRKEGRNQKCSYDEIYKETPFIFGARFDIKDEKLSKRENKFYWTLEGLVADKDVEVSYYIPPPPSSYSYSSSGSGVREPDVYDKMRNMWDSRRAVGLPTYGN